VTIIEFIAQVQDKFPPAPANKLTQFEATIRHALPDDYRFFLINSNGGYVGGRYWYRGKNPDGEKVEAGVHHIGGFRDESYFSLPWHRDCYDGRIPDALIWIHDDPFGNAIAWESPMGIAGGSTSGTTRTSRTRIGTVPSRRQATSP
jgi:SMI1-KNR4 cell-wall